MWQQLNLYQLGTEHRLSAGFDLSLMQWFHFCFRRQLANDEYVLHWVDRRSPGQFFKISHLWLWITSKWKVLGGIVNWSKRGWMFTLLYSLSRIFKWGKTGTWIALKGCINSVPPCVIMHSGKSEWSKFKSSLQRRKHLFLLMQLVHFLLQHSRTIPNEDHSDVLSSPAGGCLVRDSLSLLWPTVSSFAA